MLFQLPHAFRLSLSQYPLLPFCALPSYPLHTPPACTHDSLDAERARLDRPELVRLVQVEHDHVALVSIKAHVLHKVAGKVQIAEELRCICE